MKAFLRAVLVIIVIGAAVAAVAAFSIPRRTPNPVEPTQAVLEEGLEHFADHCAM